MTQDEIEECRWQLLYRSEYSARYHRRRASFLKTTDTLLTLVTVIAGASAFGDLVAGSPGWLAKIGAATVTVIGLFQALLQLSAAGMTHAHWMKRWVRLNAAISLNTSPLETDIQRWTEERVAVEEECVAELRALTYDCEDAASRALGVEGRQHDIHPLQRLFIHFGTFQQNFPVLDRPLVDQDASKEAPAQQKHSSP